MSRSKALPVVFILLVLMLDAATGLAQAAPQNQGGSAQNEPAATLTDWIQAVSSAVSAIVAIVLILQLSLLKRQLAQGADQLKQAKEELESGVRWNKLNAAFTYFNSDVVLQKERTAANTLLTLGFDLYNSQVPLTAEQVEKINEKTENLADVKDFLNLIEDYCTAVRIGAIDEEAAYAMMSGMVMRWEKVLRPFIDRRRHSLGDRKAYCELEKVAAAWRTKEEESKEEESLPQQEAETPPLELRPAAS